MSREREVARGVGVVGAATMVSRVLGLVREQVMATLFGAGFATDAFNVAFRIPNLLRDLFAEGAMSSAFVPTFTEQRARAGDAAALDFARRLMATLLVVLAALCAIGWIASPALVRWFAPGFESVAGKAELTVALTRIMLPFLPAVALAAAAMGVLNAYGRFGVPALAPAFLNLGMVLGGLALLPVCAAFGVAPITAMAWGVTFGGALQFAVQLPELRRVGFRFTGAPAAAGPPPPPAPWLHPGVRRVATMMIPATIGLAATQINLLVTTIIASVLEQGSVSWLWYAFRLMQLPIGVFGVALATVSLPALARAAVAGDHGALKATLSAALRLLALLTIPAAAWLAVMAAPVVALLYEHGRFGPHDTVRTAGALGAYAIGLPAFAAVGVLTRAFYAMGETRVPVIASFVAVALNLALNLLFVGPLSFLGLGHLGLALATSVTSIVNAGQLALYLRRRIGPIDGGRIAGSALRVAAAAAFALAPCALALHALGERWHRGWLAELGVVAAGGVAALALGWFALRALRVEELGALEALAGGAVRRLGIGPRTPRR